MPLPVYLPQILEGRLRKLSPGRVYRWSTCRAPKSYLAFIKGQMLFGEFPHRPVRRFKPRRQT